MYIVHALQDQKYLSSQNSTILSHEPLQLKKSIEKIKIKMFIRTEVAKIPKKEPDIIAEI